MKGSIRHRVIFAALIAVSLLVPSLCKAASRVQHPLTGYVIHFNCITNEREARQLVRIAADSGAQVINIVPPGHVWENRKALRMLDSLIDEIRRLHLAVVFTRIDASYPPGGKKSRWNYVFGEILTEAGYMPDGSRNKRWFTVTVGRRGYAQWMEEETRFYASRYGKLPNLLGINLGPFSEPFSSERGGFLEYMDATGRYEITQYTPEAYPVWHQWLARKYGDVGRVNKEYGTSFSTIDEIPMPRNENDGRFAGHADLAYFDFIRTINDWFVERYETCRRIWHETSGRKDVPFILQFSSGVAEKLAKARPGAAAFDLTDWIERADAVGLSLYTNSGYPDYGHATAMATIRLLQTARDLGKDVFVLEGGCEAPNVVLDENELKFFGSAAAPLAPKVWIYEFIKNKFDEEYRSSPGKLVRADGSLRPAAVRFFKKLFAEIQTRPPVEEKPDVAVLVDRDSLRGNRQLSIASLALYDLAGVGPLRWATQKSAGNLPTGVPVLKLGAVSGTDDMTQIIISAPEPGLNEREGWLKKTTSTLFHGP